MIKANGRGKVGGSAKRERIKYHCGKEEVS